MQFLKVHWSKKLGNLHFNFLVSVSKYWNILFLYSSELVINEISNMFRRTTHKKCVKKNISDFVLKCGQH